MKTVDVIFLDRDGVYVTLKSMRDKDGHVPDNPQSEDAGWFPQHGPDQIERINKLVEESSAVVVYCSCHRKDFDSIEHLQQFFDEAGIKAVAHGMTPGSSDGYRGGEITEYLRSHPEVRNYIIADDADDIAPHHHRRIEPCMRGYDEGEDQGMQDVHVKSGIALFGVPTCWIRARYGGDGLRADRMWILQRDGTMMETRVNPLSNWTHKAYAQRTCPLSIKK